MLEKAIKLFNKKFYLLNRLDVYQGERKENESSKFKQKFLYLTGLLVINAKDQ